MPFRSRRLHIVCAGFLLISLTLYALVYSIIFSQSTNNVKQIQKDKINFIVELFRNASYVPRNLLNEINQNIQQDDRLVIHVIQKYFLNSPSLLEYNLDNPHEPDYSYGQAPFIDNRLNYMVSMHILKSITSKLDDVKNLYPYTR